MRTYVATTCARCSWIIGCRWESSCSGYFAHVEFGFLRDWRGILLYRPIELPQVAYLSFLGEVFFWRIFPTDAWNRHRIRHFELCGKPFSWRKLFSLFWHCFFVWQEGHVALKTVRKWKEEYLYSAVLRRIYSPKALRRGSHIFTCKLHNACVSFISVHQVVLPLNEVADIQLLLLTTHLSTRRDERLSWPGCLTYSGRFTHINGYPPATGRAQDRESAPTKDRHSTAVPRNQTGGNKYHLFPEVLIQVK